MNFSKINIFNSINEYQSLKLSLNILILKLQLLAQEEMFKSHGIMILLKSLLRLYAENLMKQA